MVPRTVHLATVGDVGVRVNIRLPEWGGCRGTRRYPRPRCVALGPRRLGGARPARSMRVALEAGDLDPSAAGLCGIPCRDPGPDRPGRCGRAIREGRAG